jgi:hypothetical protein
MVWDHFVLESKEKAVNSFAQDDKHTGDRPHES